MDHTHLLHIQTHQPTPRLVDPTISPGDMAIWVSFQSIASGLSDKGGSQANRIPGTGVQNAATTNQVQSRVPAARAVVLYLQGSRLFSLSSTLSLS